MSALVWENISGYDELDSFETQELFSMDSLLKVFDVYFQDKNSWKFSFKDVTYSIAFEWRDGMKQNNFEFSKEYSQKDSATRSIQTK